MIILQEISPYFEKVHKLELESLIECKSEKDMVVWRNKLLDGSMNL
jgi:hypothetical protein